MSAQPKDGDLLCPAYLNFVRRQACIGCNAPPISAAHHYPPKGRGVVRDDHTIPVCVSCHKRCHGETIRRGVLQLSPYWEAKQQQWVDEIRLRFMAEATAAEFAAYAGARALWLETRIVVVPV